MKRSIYLTGLLMIVMALAWQGHAMATNCYCDVYVRTQNRWMDGSWALECNNHGGHGDCSNNVDSAHSAGHGAMTGELIVAMRYSGNNIYSIWDMEFPDDHETAFRGPIDGAWTTVCSCDTWHCQTNYYQDFYCYGQSDSRMVWQAGTPLLVGPYECGHTNQQLTVHNVIEEHDPWCCDDGMGILGVGFTPLAGTNVYYISNDTRNCNGGSQSGYSCGDFGQTFVLESHCFDYGKSAGDLQSPAAPAEVQSAQALTPEQLSHYREQSQQALARSIPNRRAALAARSRDEVLDQVRHRAETMGVTASPDDLTDLLYHQALWKIELDACLVENGEHAPCEQPRTELADVESLFKQTTGLTMREFRSGVRTGQLPLVIQAAQPLVPERR